MLQRQGPLGQAAAVPTEEPPAAASRPARTGDSYQAEDAAETIPSPTGPVDYQQALEIMKKLQNLIPKVKNVEHLDQMAHQFSDAATKISQDSGLAKINGDGGTLTALADADRELSAALSKKPLDNDVMAKLYTTLHNLASMENWVNAEIGNHIDELEKDIGKYRFLPFLHHRFLNQQADEFLRDSIIKTKELVDNERDAARGLNAVSGTTSQATGSPTPAVRTPTENGATQVAPVPAPSPSQPVAAAPVTGNNPPPPITSNLFNPRPPEELKRELTPQERSGYEARLQELEVDEKEKHLLGRSNQFQVALATLPEEVYRNEVAGHGVNDDNSNESEKARQLIGRVADAYYQSSQESSKGRNSNSADGSKALAAIGMTHSIAVGDPAANLEFPYGVDARARNRADELLTPIYVRYQEANTSRQKQQLLNEAASIIKFPESTAPQPPPPSVNVPT